MLAFCVESEATFVQSAVFCRLGVENDGMTGEILGVYNSYRGDDCERVVVVTCCSC